MHAHILYVLIAARRRPTTAYAPVSIPDPLTSYPTPARDVARQMVLRPPTQASSWPTPNEARSAPTSSRRRRAPRERGSNQDPLRMHLYPTCKSNRHLWLDTISASCTLSIRNQSWEHVVAIIDSGRAPPTPPVTPAGRCRAQSSATGTVQRMVYISITFEIFVDYTRQRVARRTRKVRVDHDILEAGRQAGRKSIHASGATGVSANRKACHPNDGLTVRRP